MRYQVPQFIDVEDKVIGPLTVKQFIYLAGGAGMSFVVFKYLPIYISILLIAVIAPVSVALAFYKINNKPFIDFMESAFLFYTKQNLYIWKREDKQILRQENAPVNQPAQVYVPKISDSRLKDLTWTLDINENLNPLTGKDGKTTK